MKKAMKNQTVFGALRFGSLLLVLFASAVALAQVRTLTDSTRPVASPDGKKIVIVDRIFRVIDGELERYPSRMLVRISETGSTVTRQRLIDASQVRLLNPPRWIDTRWSAFTYNISKNANGVVYINSDTAEALQMEFVALRRRMAATDTVEVELTSFEVTHYGTRVVRIPNITRRNRSVFPLFLRPLPPYDTTPFPWVYAEQVMNAVTAFQEFLAKNKVSSLRVEEASESFAPEDKMLAALACVDGKPSAILFPLEAENAAAALERARLFSLDPEITLTCQADTAAQSGDAPTSSTINEDNEPLGHFGEYRFRTSWKDEATALVEQEVFESEEQEPHRIPLYALHLDGKIEKLGGPKTADASTSAALANNMEVEEGETTAVETTNEAEETSAAPTLKTESDSTDVPTSAAPQIKESPADTKTQPSGTPHTSPLTHGKKVTPKPRPARTPSSADKQQSRATKKTPTTSRTSTKQRSSR